MAAKTATRQLILEAVVTCIEKYGIDKLTTRKIAQEAGTNIAAINYYFRSKDELVAETMGMTIEHMMEDVFLSIDAEQPFEAKLTDVFFYMLDGGRQFPGITQAHLFQSVLQKDRDSVSRKAMVRVFERLSERADKEYPNQDPKRIRLLISGVMSSVLFSMLSPSFFPLAREYHANNAKNARRIAQEYAQDLILSLKS